MCTLVNDCGEFFVISNYSNPLCVLQRMDGMGLPDAQMLRYLSSGSVSKGFYLQKNFNDSIIPRNHLVDIPDNVQFCLPSIQETAETYDFSNQELSETFVRVLNNGGISLAASFFSKISFVLVRKKKDINKLKGSKDPYFKKWLRRDLFTTICVPTASVQIENTQRCRLSKVAMNNLEKLGNYFQKTGLTDDFYKHCDDFFIEFGSHYFVGTYHLGGRRKDSRTEEINETNENKCEQKEEKERQEKQEKHIQKHEKNQEDKQEETGTDEKDGEEGKKKHNNTPSIQTTYEKFGGSLSDDDICTWKRSLIGKPYSWFVIDKEESPAVNYRGVWKLVDDVNFGEQDKFSDALHKAWNKLTGLTIDPEIDGTDFLLENQIKIIEQKVDEDIFLLNCTENISNQTGRKTTVSDMIFRVINKDSFDRSPSVEGKIEDNLRSVTAKEFDMTVARLFEKYLTEIDQTGDVLDSIAKVLEREKLTPEQKANDNRYDSSMNLSSASTSSEEIVIDSSNFEENQKSDQKSNQDELEVTTFYECHPHCKDCSKCKWCPVCCMVKST